MPAPATSARAGAEIETPSGRPVRVPGALFEIFRALDGAGARSWLAGECLLQLTTGVRPIGYQALTTATSDELLAGFPRAVPTGPRAGVVTVPSAAGPVDFRPARGPDPPHADLARSGLTVLAIGLDPLAGGFVDPWDGLADSDALRLRVLGPPHRARGSEAASGHDPTSGSLGLRAARLIAEYGLAPDRDSEEAARHSIDGLDGLPAARLRGEVRRLLLGAHVAPALAFLRRSGLEQALVSGVRDDAAAVAASLPARLDLRLAAWLRGADARGLLRRCAFGVHLSNRLYRLLDLHPIDRAVDPRKEIPLRRLLVRIGEDGAALLLALREAEIDIGAQRAESSEERERLAAEGARLARTRAAVDALLRRQREARSRPKLALSGSEIMQALDCGPGPRVGEAIRHLNRRIAEDPSRNTPEALRSELEEWNAG